MGNPRRSRGETRLVNTRDDITLRPDRDSASALEENVQALIEYRDRVSHRLPMKEPSWNDPARLSTSPREHVAQLLRSSFWVGGRVVTMT
jgi:hypothetical protein